MYWHAFHDSLWQMEAIPPTMVCGHASTTLEQNRVSQQNRNMPSRLEALTYDYCVKPKDYLRNATLMRWPKGSPALESLVRRIRPMVDMTAAKWVGGDDFLTVMHCLHDSFVCWVLRGGFNSPDVHTPIPYFAWGQPLEVGPRTSDEAWIPSRRLQPCA